MNELFHESYEGDYAEARARIEHDAAASRERSLQKELETLDSTHRQDVLQRFVTQERRKTINFASSLSLLLRVNNIRPEIEAIDSVPIFETKGFFRKKEVEVGTRQQIVLEGWPVEIEDTSDSTVDSFFRFNQIANGAIALTLDENTNSHAPLVWYHYLSADKSNIQTLPSTPLAYTDIQWYLPPAELEKKRLSKQTKQALTVSEMVQAKLPQSRYIDAEVNPDRIENIKYRREHKDEATSFRDFVAETQLLNQTPDYETYIKAGIERKIQKALASIAAKYSISG